MAKTNLVVAKGVISGITGVVSYYLGGFDYLIKFLVLFILLDWLTGFLCASLGVSKHGEGVSSYQGMLGVVKKLMLLVLVAVAFGFDNIIGKPLTRNITTAGIAINEAISILENASLLGVWIPPFLKNVLEVTRKSVSEEGTMPGEQ